MSFRLAADVRYRLVLDEAVVVCQQAAEVLGLNPVGARILDLAAGGGDLEQMIETLGAEFEVEADRLRADVPRFLDELVAAGVLEPAKDS